MGEMSALWMILSRSIHAFGIKKKETKQQQKGEQQRLSDSEQSDESARFQRSIQPGRELGGHENPRVDSDHGPNSSIAVVPSPLQTFDRLDTEVVDALEDKPPMYDHYAARLPPYDQGRFPHRRRQRERSHGDVGNGVQINERPGACTRMRIMDQGVYQGGAVIWYDALEDRYEVISSSLAPPTEPPLPPPYMPNRCFLT